ncbi:PRC-barrel domain-containing protein [Pseudomonas antarctica]|uniref:PRC-barrel domain protein n=2 Tax=Pseudomonas antarctica TaxID=219572 RepID=A0A1H0BZN3_9PSED|nr:PRC-barrel domain protein [Pseudomonas antarctica]SDN51094.1 PRC-barrel domain-containing protein [Pseudomonas antarctica]
MLRSMQDLKDYTIAATDGDIGEVKDFYFDNEAWVIRYFIVETGAWFFSRKVLITPSSIQRPEWEQRRLQVAITQEQVKNSPDIDTDKPVSRQHERQYLNYYGYPYYWGGANMWSAGLDPGSFGLPEGEVEEARARHEDDDPHLRSCKAIIGYHINATDGAVGHVESLLINEETWAIQYLVINTSHWWIGHNVLIAPEWIDEISWADRSVTVDLDCASIKASPPFESSQQLNRERESNLYEHYGRVGYWQVETLVARQVFDPEDNT